MRGTCAVLTATLLNQPDIHSWYRTAIPTWNPRRSALDPPRRRHVADPEPVLSGMAAHGTDAELGEAARTEHFVAVGE
jgi:hypothetical protein